MRFFSSFLIVITCFLAPNVFGVGSPNLKGKVRNLNSDPGISSWQKQQALSNAFDDFPSIPCRQSNPADVPTGPPNSPSQCTTVWRKTFHLYGQQTFAEDRQLKCCDAGCVTNLAKAEFCPDHQEDEAKQVEVVDSALNGIQVRDCKVRSWVAEAARATLIPCSGIFCHDNCFWTVDCTYAVECRVDNSTCQG